MARRYSKKSSEGLGMAILLIFGAIAAGVKAVFDFISNNIEVFSVIALAVAIIVIVALIYNAVVKKHRRVLLNDILDLLYLENIDNLLPDYDDRIIVKSRQALNNYTDLKYLKDNDCFDYVWRVSESK